MRGCEEFVGGLPADVRLVARVIGAPDVGTVVERVSLDGAPHASEELTECLTESIVALDLPPVRARLEEDVTIALFALAGVGLGASSDSALEKLDDDEVATMLSEHGVALPAGATIRMFAPAEPTVAR